jgi:TctA family transporter
MMAINSPCLELDFLYESNISKVLMPAGSFMMFLTRPISGVLLGFALLLLLSAILPHLEKHRQEYEKFQE